jgi:hypothetical protein
MSGGAFPEGWIKTFRVNFSWSEVAATVTLLTMQRVHRLLIAFGCLDVMLLAGSVFRIESGAPRHRAALDYLAP